MFFAGSAASPVLSFNHKYDFTVGDSANVEVSINFGADWRTLANFTGTATNIWSYGRVSLAAYTNNAVLVRFRITTSVGATADGWHVDNISVAESPSMMAPPVLSEVTAHSIHLTWTAATNSVFARYAIYRDTNSSVGITSTLVTNISDYNTTNFTDTGLKMDTTYYYRIYAVGPYGTMSPDSPAASSYRTAVESFPFSENFDGTFEKWMLTGTWGMTTGAVHSGSAALTDSPSGSYSNSTDTAALTAVNLTGSAWPVLKFWDRYHIAVNDYGFVEVSPDGATWTRVYGVSGARTNWTEQTIDLSAWRMEPNLRVRFHLMTDAAGVDDGWTIDDVTIADHTPALMAPPFAEGFENGLTNWITAPWAAARCRTR
jgi:hypothetical protein